MATNRRAARAILSYVARGTEPGAIATGLNTQLLSQITRTLCAEDSPRGLIRLTQVSGWTRRYRSGFCTERSIRGGTIQQTGIGARSGDSS